MGRRVAGILFCSLFIGLGCATEEDTSRPSSGALERDRTTGLGRPEEGGPTLRSEPSTPGATGPATSTSAVRRKLGTLTTGIATFYDADGSGNCSFEASSRDRFFVAPNKERYYAGSAICGACMRVTGSRGSVVVRVVDSCPLGQEDGDCGETGADLDLSAEAFAAIDAPSKGIVDVTFELVPCEVVGPIQIRFKSGSSVWWTAVQIENHRLPIATVEYAADGGWLAMEREDDNFFVAPSGVGRSSDGLRLRITSSTGDVIEETVPGVLAGETWTGTQQFP